MSQWEPVRPKDLEGNFFTRIGEDWMLIGAAKGDTVNMMTASWGGIGIYWGKPVAYCYIRPQRHTKGFVDAADGLSLTFFPHEYRAQLQLCGSKSGRDVDKVQECGFHVLWEEGIPYFDEADTALICKPLIAQPLDPDYFRDPGLQPSAYPDGDFHTLYICEIVKALAKK